VSALNGLKVVDLTTGIAGRSRRCSSPTTVPMS
jgi:hypothetical protein